MDLSAGFHLDLAAFDPAAPDVAGDDLAAFDALMAACSGGPSDPCLKLVDAFMSEGPGARRTVQDRMLSCEQCQQRLFIPAGVDEYDAGIARGNWLILHEHEVW